MSHRGKHLRLGWLLCAGLAPYLLGARGCYSGSDDVPLEGNAAHAGRGGGSAGSSLDAGGTGDAGATDLPGGATGTAASGGSTGGNAGRAGAPSGGTPGLQAGSAGDAGQGGALEPPQPPPVTCAVEEWGGTLAFGPSRVSAAHFNADGRVDLLGTPRACCATLPEDIHDVQLFLAGDEALEELPVVTVPEGDLRPRSLDLDADGLSDLAVLGEGVLRLFLNQGDGSFEPAAEHTLDAAGTPEVYDVTGDEIPDLLLRGNAASTVIVVRGGAEPGTVNAPLTLPVAELPRVGPDFDGNGHPDTLRFVEGVLEIRMSDRSGDLPSAPTFEYPTSLTPPRSPYLGGAVGVTLGDFNGDARLDAFYTYGAANLSEISQGAVRIGRDDGTFDAETPLSFAGLRPLEFLAADLSGDDDADELVVASLASGDAPVVTAYRFTCSPVRSEQ
ncbi:MAG TPA: FG-GAP-like repeat-containing protein [Polyangiaceae bacterium]